MRQSLWHRGDPIPQKPVEQEDGSLFWPTDPHYVPEPIEGHDITMVEVDDKDDDYGDPEADPTLEDSIDETN